MPVEISKSFIAVWGRPSLIPCFIFSFLAAKHTWYLVSIICLPLFRRFTTIKPWVTVYLLSFTHSFGGEALRFTFTVSFHHVHERKLPFPDNALTQSRSHLMILYILNQKYICFHLMPQQMEMSNSLASVLEKQDELMKEVQSLRRENHQLRRLL